MDGSGFRSFLGLVKFAFDSERLMNQLFPMHTYQIAQRPSFIMTLGAVRMEPKSPRLFPTKCNLQNALQSQVLPKNMILKTSKALSILSTSRQLIFHLCSPPVSVGRNQLLEYTLNSGSRNKYIFPYHGSDDSMSGDHKF